MPESRSAVEQIIASSLKDNQKIFLIELSKAGENRVTLADISKRMGRNRRQIRAILSSLEDLGIVEILDRDMYNVARYKIHFNKLQGEE